MSARPPRWSEQRFQDDLARSLDGFRAERVQEPLEDYLGYFDQALGAVEEVLELTADLAPGQREAVAVEVLADERLLTAARYLAGPPISDDDLQVVAEASSLAPTRLRADPEMARRALDVIMQALDRRRFPWVGEGREPTEAERQAAAIGSAALIANRRTLTKRANSSKDQQELLACERLLAAGFSQVPKRTIRTLDDCPGVGEFCGEVPFGPRKADLVIRLWDRRVMPLECKVSNSSVNSVKRLNNDAAVKAVRWIEHFGTAQTVPAALISGVFKVKNLLEAQAAGLTIFWSHDLDEMIAFIEATRPH